ncbi:MAG: ketopantoate reductase family protein [[Clostridium] scindens]
MKVKIIGMGALGVMYANYIKERAGEDAVCFVMDSSRLERYEGQVFLCNKKEQTFCMEDSEKAEKADLVIVAVKYNGLASAIETMKHCVGDGTIIMSVMNGISSEDRIAAQYGADKMICTVAVGDGCHEGSAANLDIPRWGNCASVQNCRSRRRM